MSESDMRIVTIILFFAAIYGVWMFMYANEQTGTFNSTLAPQNYTDPSSSSFFSQLKKTVSISVSNPEIGFINTILFIPLGILVAFVFLRYLRGI